MLQERNKNYGAIKFVDISSGDYSPAENQGLDYETVCCCCVVLFCEVAIVVHILYFDYFVGNFVLLFR